MAATLCVLGCVHAAPPPAAAPVPPPGATTGEVSAIPADPAKGFEFPYLLRLPDPAPVAGTATFLLVETNNTGSVSDDFEVHRAAAEKAAKHAVGGSLVKPLGVPLLMPVFPRPETGWQLYTHALDRDTMLVRDGPLRRLDLQLLAMIDDARARLAAAGIPTHDRVLMTGFSASGTFANRFTLLHPERVQAVATGGVNGILMLPLMALDDTALPYPLGLADFATIAGRPFAAAAWGRVRQFIYMGAEDRNDAVDFDDGYEASERAIVHAKIGKVMQPDRWAFCQAIYRDASARVTFRTYDGIGHGTNGEIHAELVEFFRQAIASE